MPLCTKQQAILSKSEYVGIHNKVNCFLKKYHLLNLDIVCFHELLCNHLI